MLGVLALTFCIILSSVNSLPVYQSAAADPYAASSYPAVDPYAGSPAYVPPPDYLYQFPQPVSYANPYPQVVLYDPYSVGGYPVSQAYLQPQPYPQVYPQVDPYAQVYPQVDPYAQVYPQVDPYAQVYPQVDPYAQVYPQVDPYAQVYPQVDPYAQVYPQVDPYAQVYPQVDPYVQPYPQVDPYVQPYPQMVDPYAQPQLYPQPDPYQPSTTYPTQAQVYSPPPYSPSIDPYSLSVPQSYQLAPVYPQTPYAPPVYEQVDTYLAVTSHTKDYRKHCGIIPATNDDIYSDSIPGSVNDVLPYGAFPWLALIMDLDDYTVPCLATMIHSEYALTVSSCITKPAGSYAVIKDWDILTKYNEYEAYKSYADPVCTYWPLGVDNSSGEAMFTMAGSYDSELILLIGPLEEHHSEYPADEILCLPSHSSALPSSYSNYAPPPYSPSPYPSYSPPPYSPQPPPYSPYPQLSYDYSNVIIPTGECWVAGYRYSPTAILQNHPPLVPINGGQPQYSSSQGYYSTLDNSVVPRKALVRQIQCPPGYPSPGYDDVCFVGINGYDACVADIGTAVFCIIDDTEKPYQSGFADDITSNHGVIPEPVYLPNSPPSQPIYQQQPIQVLEAQQLQPRRRAILYAVVKAPTSACMTPSPPVAYQPNYQPNYQLQSNYIVGARVNPSIRAALQDLFWETGMDISCPTQKAGDVLPGSINQGYINPSYPPTSIQPQLYDPSLLSPYPQPYPQSYPQPYPQSYPQPYSQPYPQPNPYQPSPSYPQPYPQEGY